MATPSTGTAIGAPKGHNIPLPLTSLIGRRQELRGVAEALRRTRLVTVTGPGGVGKTRLAIEFALDQTKRRLDGAWLVDLALGSGTPDVASEAARILDVAPGADRRRRRRFALTWRIATCCSSSTTVST